MVFTGMPYSSWKGRSETEEERQERYQIQQESIVTLFQIMLYRRLSKFLELFLELI